MLKIIKAHFPANAMRVRQEHLAYKARLPNFLCYFRKVCTFERNLTKSVQSQPKCTSHPPSSLYSSASPRRSPHSPPTLPSIPAASSSPVSAPAKKATSAPRSSPATPSPSAAPASNATSRSAPAEHVCLAPKGRTSSRTSTDLMLVRRAGRSRARILRIRLCSRFMKSTSSTTAT